MQKQIRIREKLYQSTQTTIELSKPVGADDWVSIEMFGKAKEAWFTEVLGLEHGIPSHLCPPQVGYDTFGNVFAVIDTQQFSACFSRWAADLADLSGGEIIAVDGKCLRRSMDGASNKAAIYMVSAWATQNQLVLGQQKVDDKSNEIIYAHRRLGYRHP